MAETETKSVIESSDIVTYLVKVGDEEIAKEYQVLSITVETGINKIPRASLLISDGNPSEKNYEVSDSKVFRPGKKIEVQLGYQKDQKVTNESVFKGMIIKNSHKAGSNSSEFNIECKHEAEKMTLDTKSNHFDESKDTDIINKILEPYNLEIDEIEESMVKQPQLMQINKSDWDYMISRLDVSGLMCIFPLSKLKIQNVPTPPAPPEKEDQKSEKKEKDIKEFTLTYGRNILEFNGDVDARTQPEKVVMRTWDFKKQAVIETENDGDSSGKTEQDESENKVNNTDHTMQSNSNITEEGQKLIVNAKKLRTNLSKIKAKVKFLGSTKVAPGDFIALQGLGDNFNGKVFVSNILHEYSDGCWITEATLGWDEKFFTEQTNPGHPASATGQSSSIQGLHIGKVTSIEDKDGDYRVKVKLPMVDNASDGIYARVAALDAGKNRGTFFRPEIDDEVVLGFMSDDPSNPVILGMLHSSALPAPLEPEKNNHKKGYVSRSEIKLLFDDDNKSLLIETPGKRVFELNDNAGTISLKDEFGNKIVMEQSGVTIESGADLTLKATGKFSLSAAKFEMKADSTVNLEGNGQVSVKSSAVTEIKGSIVKLN